MDRQQRVGAARIPPHLEAAVPAVDAVGGRRMAAIPGASPPGRTVVVVPTYNEAQNLPRLVSAMGSLELPDLWILVVDDNSPDGTGRIAEGLRSVHPRLEVLHREGKLGLGTAYVAGFKRALELGADYLVQMDADLSHAPDRIPGMLELARKADVVVGSRYVEGGELDAAWGCHRRLLSAAANSYARTILRVGIRDVTGGFRCLSRRAVEALELDTIRSNGYAFQVEMVHRFQRLGLRLQEFPIHFYERNGGASKMSIGVMFEAAWRVWQLRLRPWKPCREE